MGLAGVLGAGWDHVNDDHIEPHPTRGRRDTVGSSSGRRAMPSSRSSRRLAARCGGGRRGATCPRGARVAGRRRRFASGWASTAGEAHLAGDDYGGFEVNRAARVAAAGHGGQILLSETSAVLVTDAAAGRTSRSHDLGRARASGPPSTRAALPADDRRAADAPFRRRARPARSSATMPVRMTSFIGREAELETRSACSGTRGSSRSPGPAASASRAWRSKSRETLASEYPDGAWFVPSPTLDDPAEMAGPRSPDGSACSTGRSARPRRALRSYLAERTLLLVLDNFEHLLDGGDRRHRHPGRSSPQPSDRGTSRAPLHLSGEHESAAPAAGRRRRAALHRPRRRALRPGWTGLRPSRRRGDLRRCWTTCRSGSSWRPRASRSCRSTVIRDRLAAHLPLPGPGPRDVPARQRTLDGAVAWSARPAVAATAAPCSHVLSVFDGRLRCWSRRPSWPVPTEPMRMPSSRTSCTSPTGA